MDMDLIWAPLYTLQYFIFTTAAQYIEKLSHTEKALDIPKFCMPRG